MDCVQRSHGRALLEVRDLCVTYGSGRGPAMQALQQIEFSVQQGECVGMVGESGSGKTSLALALLGLLPATAQVTAGTVCLDGEDLLSMPERRLRSVRGARISLVPQEPAQALHPTLCVGTQIADLARVHSRLDRRSARAAAEQALREVALTPADRIFHAYPHQLSGGQRQRVVLAQALVCHPQLLIADEPTSSLDQVTQAEILDLLRRLQQKHGFALLLISHDPAVIEAMAERLIVLRDGRIVEQGETQRLLRSPQESYTQSLLDCRSYRHVS